MQYQWGYGLGNADSNYADVSGTPTAPTWSHSTSGVIGHRRFHFFAVSRSGRTSFQDSGSSGGSRFQDAGNYARYYDVYVDNVAPQNPSFSSVTASSTNQINLVWTVPLDQGANVAPGSTESASAAGNQDSQNWYRVGDVGVQLYRDGSVLSPWGAGMAFNDAGLAANTAYTYTLEARDNNSHLRGAWNNSTGQQATNTTWTLSAAPTAASIVASQTNIATGSNITWTAVGGFGPGKLQYYRYAWDQSATHTFTGTEAQWSSGTITTVPTSEGIWYLHASSYNGADLANGSYDYAVVAENQTQCSLTNAVLATADNRDGTFTVTFVGTPQARYYLVTHTNLAVPAGAWVPMPGSTNTVTNSTGLWFFTLTNTAPQRFYRSAAANPCL
jgi:hypothetical protein